MPTIKVKTNAKDYIKMLKKKHGALALVSANTVNVAAKVVEKKYKRELEDFTLRNQFTKKSVRILKSKPQSKRTGEFRPIKDINAVVGVRTMKGGKQHYLQKQEEGDRVRGTGKTKGGVPIPLDIARAGGSHGKPIKTALRLQNTGTIQTLRMKGDTLGVPGSKFLGQAGAQSWAIFHKYSGTSKRNRNVNNRYGWNLDKPFFFMGMKRGLGIFKFIRKRARMIRTLEEKSVKIRATNKFQKTVDKITPGMMGAIFKRAAERHLKG